MIEQIREHRSIRRFRDTPVDPAVIDTILEAGTRASNTGNMQLYSMISTTSPELLARLAACHFDQPASRAPLIVTFCADRNRFDKWCVQRGAAPGYDNFAWFVNALTDAVLASQNVALEAEAAGLGVCYLGTVIHSAERIAQILELPAGVVPVAALAVGWPDESPGLTDRLPLTGVAHRETYHDYTPADIDAIWREREGSELTAELKKANGLPSLASIFTERRYRAADNVALSRSYLEFIKKQGFFNQ